MSQALFPTRWKHDRPPSIERFLADFPDDYACAEHLARMRWPEGFMCPNCGSSRGWRLETRPWLFQCGAGRCRKQTSVIAGTVMHGTHLPLRSWFVAAYLMTTHSNAISALQLQAKLGLGSYKSAWLLLHKLRRAMADPDPPLGGAVEIAVTSVPLRRRADDSGRKGVLVIGAVERLDGNRPSRIRLRTIAGGDAVGIRAFAQRATDKSGESLGDPGGQFLNRLDQQWFPIGSVRGASPAPIAGLRRAFSNLKRWGLGTFHGFRAKHLDAYLDEFAFRWNRRRSFQTAMDALLGLGQRVGPTTYRDIVGDSSDWRRVHQAQILGMVSSSRLAAAQHIATEAGIALIDALAATGKRSGARPRGLARRPILPPRPAEDGGRARSSRIVARRVSSDEIDVGWLGPLRGTPLAR